MKRKERKGRLLRALALLTAAAMLIVPLAACSSDTGGRDHSFSFSLTANPKNLDPQMANDNNSLMIIKNIFEGLMRVGPNGELIYGVAESYTSNDDDTEYVFTLRDDAKWADGTPVTAYDFAFAWKRALDPTTQSPTCASLYCIRNASAVNDGSMSPDELGVTVIDAQTIKVLLEYSYAEFPLQTTLAVYMPCSEAFFESTGGHYGLDDIYMLSNGPFYLTEKGWSADNYVYITRNEEYHGTNEVCPRKIYFGIRPSSTDYLTLLEETVEAAKIESYNVEALAEKDYLTYSYTDCTWGILFNTTAAGFEDPYVRQAFALCVETYMYEQFMPDNTVLAYDIIPPATKLNGVLYRELAGSGMKLKADLGSAYRILKQGLSNEERSSMPTITVICPDDKEYIEMMQQLVQSWQDNLMIYVNLEPISEATLQNRVNIGEFQIALWCLDPSNDGPLNCLKMFDSSTYYNPANLNSGAFDHLIDISSAKTNTEDILAPLTAAEKYLNDMAVFFPMFYETSYYATWRSVDGIYFSPFDGTADFTCAVCYDD